jgi:hypothetical protein
MKMEKIVLLMICLITTQVSYSQTISSYVISNSGSNYTVGRVSIDWTLGESVIDILQSNNCINTQGFHQTFSSENAFQKELGNTGIRVFPNPTREILHISFTGLSDFNAVELCNMAGQKLFHKNIKTDETTHLNMKPYSDGIYILTFSGNQKAKIQIIKSLK